MPKGDTMEKLLLTNVQIGSGLRNLLLNRVSGCIERIMPANKQQADPQIEKRDANGLLYLPALKDWHVHVDKHFLGEPWKPLQPFKSLETQLKFEQSLLSSMPSTAAQRARLLIERLLSHGTTSIRTHVDIDPIIGLKHLEDVLRIRDEYRGRVTIEIVAFPQQGLLRSDSISLMKRALREGADLVGGVDPAGLDRQVDRSVAALFELSSEFDVGIDLHLHDPGQLGIYTIERFAELTEDAGKQGRTAVSHAYCLGQVSETESMEVAHRLKQAGVGIMTSVPIDVEMPRIGQLLEAGVKVGVGCDNILDAWSPFGNGDILARGSRLAEKLKWRMDDELLRVLPLISSGPLEPREGDTADFVLVDAMNAMHAVASAPKREAVFVGGNLASGTWFQKERNEKNNG